MEQVNPVSILLSIKQNAACNLQNNIENIESIEDAVQAAHEYVEGFGSVIASNINDVDDLVKLRAMLRLTQMHTAYQARVLQYYLEETERHLEAEANEIIAELVGDYDDDTCGFDHSDEFDYESIEE